MRQIVIDELSPMERDNIDSYLKRNTKPGPMIGLYWIVLPEELLGEAQRGEEHKDHGPYYLAAEVEQYSVKFELLVRSQTNLHCTCIGHATSEQRQYLLDFIDKMTTEEMIKA